MHDSPRTPTPHWGIHAVQPTQIPMAYTDGKTVSQDIRANFKPTYPDKHARDNLDGDLIQAALGDETD